MTANEIIEIVAHDNVYKSICVKINPKYSDDLFQEVCCEILTMPEERLPEPNYLRWWFYRVALGMMNPRHGKFGRQVYTPLVKIAVEDSNEVKHEELLRDAEEFMLSLTDFERCVVLLYKELGDLKKVERATGISYSALRAVKEKIKQKRAEVK